MLGNKLPWVDDACHMNGVSLEMIGNKLPWVDGACHMNGVSPDMAHPLRTTGPEEDSFTQM